MLYFYIEIFIFYFLKIQSIFQFYLILCKRIIVKMIGYPILVSCMDEKFVIYWRYIMYQGLWKWNLVEKYWLDKILTNITKNRLNFETMQVKTLKNLIFALKGSKPLKNLIFAPSQPLRQLCSLLIIMHQIYIYKVIIYI